jgi:adenosine kinase
MLQDKTGSSLEELAKDVKALVVTLGAQGSLVHAGGTRHEIPCVKADRLVDPTGCGDAYRAGLLYGITQGWDWPVTARLGAVMGAIKIAHRGGQNHAPSRDEIEERYKAAFGFSPWR